MQSNYNERQNVREYGAKSPCSHGRTCVVPRTRPVPASLCQSTPEGQSTPRWFHLSTRQSSLRPSVQPLSADHRCRWRRRRVPDQWVQSRVQTPWIGRTASVNSNTSVHTQAWLLSNTTHTQARLLSHLTTATHQYTHKLGFCLIQHTHKLGFCLIWQQQHISTHTSSAFV